MNEIGIDRKTLYITNTVKHFKFEPRGKRRMHARANAREQAACRPWLDAELASLRPEIVVCLGSMAASAMFGMSFRLLQQRGSWLTLASGARGFATVHPSYLLRLPDEAKDDAYRQFVTDLQMMGESAG